VRRVEFNGSLEFHPIAKGQKTDVLVIPKAATDLEASRKEFFRVLTDPRLFPGRK
jgi:hypothetical protein